MESRYFANVVGQMIELQQGTCPGVDIDLALARSAMLSSDGAATFDPTFPAVSETRNNAYWGKSVALIQYTGSRGKAGSNDASAEYVGEIRRVLNAVGVVWQTSELGNVDQGGRRDHCLHHVQLQYGCPGYRRSCSCYARPPEVIWRTYT